MKDAESGEKSNILRDDVLALPYFENASECKCSMTVKSRLLTSTPVHFPIIMREPLQNSFHCLM